MDNEMDNQVLDENKEETKEKIEQEVAEEKDETTEEKEESKEDIIGGLIMADPILNMKIDMSMRTIIEESKERIVEIITLALREAGEQVG